MVLDEHALQLPFLVGLVAIPILAYVSLAHLVCPSKSAFKSIVVRKRVVDANEYRITNSHTYAINVFMLVFELRLYI